MFSTLESQGARSDILWGIWTIHPDGTNWNPLVSAFDPGGAPNGFHFQTQLSDGSIVVEEYYNQNNSGFGTLHQAAAESPPDGYAGVRPGAHERPAEQAAGAIGRLDNGNAAASTACRSCRPGTVSLTPFATASKARPTAPIRGDKNSPAVGKFTHPSGAPDNHLLTVLLARPGQPPVHATCRSSTAASTSSRTARSSNEPAQMRLIKNDPNYNECWPRAVVPYKRIYGVDEPKRSPRWRTTARCRRTCRRARRSAWSARRASTSARAIPNGVVPKGKVTATYAGRQRPVEGARRVHQPRQRHAAELAQPGRRRRPVHERRHPRRPHPGDGADDRPQPRREVRPAVPQPRQRAAAHPRRDPAAQVRRTASSRSTPTATPTRASSRRSPPTSAFTFQTLDKRRHGAEHGPDLAPAPARRDPQQLRRLPRPQPEADRLQADRRRASPTTRCGTWSNTTPLLTDKAKRRDRSRSGTRRTRPACAIAKSGPLNVEYRRDIKPILDAQLRRLPHREGRQGAGRQPRTSTPTTSWCSIEHHGKFPGTYYRLALDERAKFGHKPVGYDSWGYPNASRYVRKFQSRRSLLVWKIFGERLDGFTNDDHPSETKPGSGKLFHKGKAVDLQKNQARVRPRLHRQARCRRRRLASGKVSRSPTRTAARSSRWIDLGCPIDLDYDPKQPGRSAATAGCSTTSGRR